jgi:NAD+ synthase
MLPIQKHCRSALLIVDMQVHFFRQPERRQNLEAVVENINRLSAYFDLCNLPVVHVLSCYQPDGSDWELKMKAAGRPELIRGSEEAAILTGIQVSDRHQTVNKTRYSAFFKTDLAEKLHNAGVERVVVVGAYTHYCVNATVFDAYCHDFVPGLVTDAVLSHLAEESALMIGRMRRNGYHLFTTSELIMELDRRRLFAA